LGCTKWYIRQPRRLHGALTLVHVPTLQVEAKHIADRVVAFVGLDRAIGIGLDRRAIPIPPIVLG
jgi:hypothetical protein